MKLLIAGNNEARADNEPSVRALILMHYHNKLDELQLKVQI